MELASTAIKAGTMVATGGVVADAVIFADISYMYLAITGALVSAFGVAHDIYGSGHREYSVKETLAELLKGIALGILAIPFWFLILTGIGGDMLHKYFDIVPDYSTFNSLSLIVSFGLSWFTVPIFDFIAKTVPQIVAGFVNKFISRLTGKGD